MPQSPMISVPLKATNEIDWVAPLKEYIRNTYGDDPERYAEECATLNRLRQDMRGAGKDSTAGRDMLYRYYGQLELLDLRFPVDEQHIKISFTWFDAFTHKSTSQYSLAFEKASIIFNISAVLSCHAANQNRSEESGLKMSYHSFQAAAGMFTYINENFLHAPSVDLSRDTVKTLISIMLAQATEVFLERQIRDEKKNGLLAKLCSQSSYLYSQALEGVQENVNKAVFEKVWLMVVQIKMNLLGAMAQYYQSLADDDANHHGVAIGRLQVAERMAKEANKTAMSFPSSAPSSSNLASECGTTLQEMAKRHLITIQEKLAELTKDNDFIYHQVVPAEATLSPVPKLPAAKPIPVTELYAGQDIQRITGPDLFAKIVPMAVTESASLYDEEKAKLVRAEQERVEIANTEITASLDYLRLPGSLQLLKGGVDQDLRPDDDFRTWCEDVAGHENPASIFESLLSQKAAIISILDNCKKDLDTEASVCEKMRSKYEAEWTQQPSSSLTTTLRNDLRSYRKALDDAAHTDSQLASKLRQNESEFAEMRVASESGDTDALFHSALRKAKAGSNVSSPAVEQNLLDADFEDGSPSVAEQIGKVEDILKKLNLLRRERNQILLDLKDKVHNDDISQILILNKKTVSNYENQIFQTELEKFRPFQNRILQAYHKQASMLKELTVTFNALLQDKRVRSEQSKWESIQRQRTSVVNKYKRAYQEFLELESGLQSAKKWYSDMKDTVESLRKNVEAFVNNRRSEGAQLLERITQNRSKPSQAELEQERLRQLMGRMSIDQPSSSPSEQSGRKPPALFSSGQAPRYDGYHQYSMPSSPPPNQMQHQSSTYGNPTLVGQQPGVQSPQSTANTGFNQPVTYDPAFYGRNPGPTSPPATQTSFGIRGPASPPATQTTFMRGPASPPPNQASFANAYGGYPQQQQQMGQQLNRPPSQGVPPRGYVPPPPPPGPPPIGPQQTIHYGSQDYPAPAGSQTGQQDPWAGLRAWK
ncbi:hypothetical protein TD95_002493 [Thielaviopsis punctulata]|uniref:BRO domain-containing protein 1 n=1 Tax=Thielaviopsis punctulata TaxID=72032 RepID=A0A0F4ZG78_9PEZI|nr:hypothetical protein TD95_002493 [Thielaviopsis punctulata]